MISNWFFYADAHLLLVELVVTNQLSWEIIAHLAVSFMKWDTPLAYGTPSLDPTETNTYKYFGKIFYQVGYKLNLRFLTYQTLLQVTNNQLSNKQGKVPITKATGFPFSRTQKSWLFFYFYLARTGRSDQFKKYYHGSQDTLKVKYDYLSIMHYGKDYFAKLNHNRRYYLTTIKTKDPKYQDKIGQRKYPTPSDILMINTMYGCPG